MSLNLKPEGGGIRQFANNVEAYAAGLKPGDMWMLSTGEVRIVIDHRPSECNSSGKYRIL